MYIDRHGNVLGKTYFHAHPVLDGREWGNILPSTGVDSAVTYAVHSDQDNNQAQGYQSKPVDLETHKPWNWMTILSMVTQVVILGVIVYLAFKDPKELGILFKYYLMFIFGLILLGVILGIMAWRSAQ